MIIPPDMHQQDDPDFAEPDEHCYWCDLATDWRVVGVALGVMFALGMLAGGAFG